MKKKHHIIPLEVHDAAKEVLSAWKLQHHLPRFLSCADGIVLVAHLCNAGAKFIDPDLYDLKPLLVQYAAELHPFSWCREGIVYIETVCGQVSFHVFEDEEENLPVRCEETGPWAGGWMQDIALELADAFLDIGTPHDIAKFQQLLDWFQPTIVAR